MIVHYLYCSLLGENFSSLLIGDLHDACSILNVTGKHVKLWMRAYWLEALIFLQKKDTYASCSALSMVIVFIYIHSGNYLFIYSFK